MFKCASCFRCSQPSCCAGHQVVLLVHNSQLYHPCTTTSINNGTSLSSILYTRAVCDSNRDVKITWVNRMLFRGKVMNTCCNKTSRILCTTTNHSRTMGLNIRSPVVCGALVTLTAAGAARVASTEQLTYLQSMTVGAVSRSIAQTLLHPANTYKTLLQLRRSRRAVPVVAAAWSLPILRGGAGERLSALYTSEVGVLLQVLGVCMLSVCSIYSC